MAILFSDSTYRADNIFAALQSVLPDLRKFPDTGNREEIEYAVIWYPQAGSLRDLPNLKAIFSVAAGVDGIMNDTTLPDVPLIRTVDDGLTQGMVEYAIYNVLRFHRHFHLYDRQQHGSEWKQHPQIRPQNRRIGVMGLGEMGRAVAEALVALKFDVRGWSRSPKEITGIKTFVGEKALTDFLSQTEILINVLPLTTETRGILNAKTLGALPDGAFLINAGRGAHMVDGDVLAALNSRKLTAAALDVFTPEPLAPESPFWKHPTVTVTPHIASITDFSAVARNIINNIKLLKNGQIPAGLVDRQRGY
jgi:glyoxylate/hydroxypyruvate reductase A